MRFSCMRRSAYSSIDVCTNEAKLRRGLPSSASSLLQMAYASAAGTPCEGMANLGTGSVP